MVWAAGQKRGASLFCLDFLFLFCLGKTKRNKSLSFPMDMDHLDTTTNTSQHAIQENVEESVGQLK